MNGVIFYDSKYGATADYAGWTAEATGLPIYQISNPEADPDRFDFLVVGSPVYLYKVMLRSWIEMHIPCLTGRPVLLFTVSGAPAGDRLDGWLADSLPRAFVAHARHFALRGRLDRQKLSWVDRFLLDWDARRNPDPVEAQREREGFDAMDRKAIAPLVAAVRGLQRAAAA